MKFSIVTPVRNQSRFVAETIESVISQKGDFEIEYVVVDGCSTDGTVEILQRYQELLGSGCWPVKCRGVSFRWLSESDAGMYDAVNKGFALATGDVFAWINADDLYLPGALQSVASVFSKYREINWLKGITSYIDESSRIVLFGDCLAYHRPWIERGLYGFDSYFIQQDSVFWRAGLWREVGRIDPSLKYAGDYFLWTRFAKREQLISLNAYLSCFRRTQGQLSQDREAYLQECRSIAPAGNLLSRMVRGYFALLEPRIWPVLRPSLRQMLKGGRKNRYVDIVDGEPLLYDAVSPRGRGR